MTVTALLVCHDGARWLPTVLAGLQGQTRPVDRIVAVDTGSTDDTVSLLTRALPRECVLYADPDTPFGEAVAIGADAAGEHEWLWILHDDANPDPTALQHLLDAADEHPDADVLGPKLREWPSLRRLLEVGVTISGTGRRETGLERGEYDQGQHDEVHEVLAVNTAGMLVRREVLERLDGFDRNLPIFGNDLDFGWRAASAGFRTLVVPQAVVFHAEAAHRGVRRTELTGGHTHFQERRAALYTLLANSRAVALPFQTVRLALGSLLRALGFLLVRSGREAGDEVAALASVYIHPGEVRRARRARRAFGDAHRERVRSLLAPAWLPYRHGLDFVSDIAVATTHQAQDVAERRRAATLAEHGTPTRTPRSEDDDDLIEDSGWLVRFLTNPRAVLLSLFVLVSLAGARPVLGAVTGGALSPAPARVADWWRLYTEHWHPIGSGSDAPAPAYLPVLAGLGTLLGGRPSLAVTLVLGLAVPLSLWGAWRLLRVVGRLVHPQGVSRWVLLAGATTYALVPVTSGAWGEGRLGTVVTAVVLPWLAHAALGFADPEPERRWRAAWRTALLLAVATAFTPSLWWLGVVLGLVALLGVWRVSPSALRDRSVLGPPLAAVASVPVLLAPWVVPLLLRGPRGGLLLETGRPPSATPSSLDLLVGRVTDLGMPVAWGAALLVLALLALLPTASRVAALACWVVALCAAAAAVVVSLVPLGLEAAGAWAGVGVFAVVIAAAWVTAAVVGLPSLAGLLPGVAGRGVAVVLGVAAAALPVLGLGWYAVGGHDDYATKPDDGIPAYMAQSSLLGPAHGVLILQGSVEDGLTYTVRRGDGATLGEDEILALTPEDRQFTENLQALLASPTTTLTNRLSEQGIEYIVLRSPADGRIAASLDATPGLSQASAEDRSTRAWQVERSLDDAQLRGPGSALRTALLWLQAAAVLVALVLSGPTRRGSS
ncbi:glycosyltransferase family 2 protein [Nocardioides sp.]|uniref:glycosyltransferase family 2 protein n=1 Tax=Nocardioides sp. TaxID=35761 RepID=UPI003527C92B